VPLSSAQIRRYRSLVGWFRRPLAPRDRRSYPQPGYFTIVSAEAQEWEFVRVRVARRSGPSSILATTAEPTWPGEDVLMTLIGELTALVSDDVSPDDLLDIRRAAALAQYGIDTGTGIQLVPPA
jgi:hypothetical protein